MYIHILKWKPIKGMEEKINTELKKRPIMKSKIEYTYFHDKKTNEFISIGYWSSKKEYDDQFGMILKWFESLEGICFEKFNDGSYIKKINEGNISYKD